MIGKELAGNIMAQVKNGAAKLREHGIEVGLGVLRVGDNLASRSYYMATLKACERAGIEAYRFELPADISINAILNTIKEINRDERINGLLVLFPLPPRINGRRVVNEIAPEKDVDGLGAISVGRLAADESTFQLFRTGAYESLFSEGMMPSVSGFLPCTPFGVIRLLEHHGVEIRGKNAVVIGKSLAVGKPLSLMLLAKEATVTICHKETRDMPRIIRDADIVCTATGVHGLVRGDMIKKGAVVVDIGIKVLDDGRIVGDLDYESVAENASLVTPVPGGVGPVTISMLLENTLQSALRTEQQKSPLFMG